MATAPAPLPLSQQLQQIMTRILEIIDFQADRNAFMQKFIDICINQASKTLQEKLSAKQQEALQEAQQQNQNMSLEEQFALVKKISGISDNGIKSILFETTQNVLKDYLTTIIPSLSPSQKVNLQAYLATLPSFT